MRKLKAFTLVELLVVISIIALLMAILMPSLSKAREQAWRIVCGNHLRTVGMGDQMYSDESDDWHVPAYYLNPYLSQNPPKRLWFQNPLFVKIVDMKDRYNREDDREEYEGASYTLPKDFKCPADKRTVENGGLHLETVEEGLAVQGVSYAMNMEAIRPLGGGPWQRNIVYALKTMQVVRPSEKIHFMDGQWFVVYILGAEYKRVWDKNGDKMSGNPEWDAASYRHNEGANIAFYDGHVEYRRKEKVYPYIKGDIPKQLRAREAIWMPIPGRDLLRGP